MTRPVHRKSHTDGPTVVALCGDRRELTKARWALNGTATSCPACLRLEALGAGFDAVEAFRDAVRDVIADPGCPDDVAMDLQVAVAVLDGGLERAGRGLVT